MSIAMDSNTALVLIIACVCAYGAVSAWAGRGKND